MSIKGIIIVWIVSVSVAITGIALGLWTAELEPNPLHVTSKAEADGKCYIQTWVEVTPEEYVGLDIGDEFGGKQ